MPPWKGKGLSPRENRKTKVDGEKELEAGKSVFGRVSARNFRRKSRVFPAIKIRQAKYWSCIGFIFLAYLSPVQSV